MNLARQETHPERRAGADEASPRDLLVRPRSSAATFTIAFTTLLLAGCADSPAPNQQQQQQATNESLPVTVVAAGDTHGWIIPCGCTSNQSGGLLRRATYVEQLKEAGPVLVLDVGGAADGTAPYQRERMAAILKGEKLMELQAHNVGQAELNFGVRELTKLGQQTGVKFLSTNLQVDENAVFPTTLLSEIGGQKLLITGVLSPQYATPDVTIVEPATAILQAVESTTEKYDRLIVLAYLPPDELRSLAGSLPEADAIIGGPTGQAIAPEFFGRSVMLSATNKGKFLAQVTFTGKAKPQASVVEMSTTFADHKQQTDNLKAFRNLLAQRDFTAAESGFAPASIHSSEKVAGTESCRECHDQTTTHWDTTGHAHAWDTLAQEGAHVDPYCQQCHTTGYGQPDGFLSANNSALHFNVGCESCHGPSAAHAADETVKTPFDAVGSCRRCHDAENSPHFEFDSYWDKVKHE